tara:strand:- start:91 stop:351 length:261 start_codon:yes stop_codon:yes gene_type:complete
MAQLFNKNGLLIGDNLKAIQDELIRGTGFVMGENISAFMERESLHEKNIVISIDEGKGVPVEKKFIVQRMNEALELFQRLLRNQPQ